MLFLVSQCWQREAILHKTLITYKTGCLSNSLSESKPLLKTAHNGLRDEFLDIFTVQYEKKKKEHVVFVHTSKI